MAMYSSQELIRWLNFENLFKKRPFQ